MREGVYGGFTGFLYLPYCHVTGGILQFNPDTLGLALIAFHVGFGPREDAWTYGFGLDINDRDRWILHLRFGRGPSRTYSIKITRPACLVSSWARYSNWLRGR